MNTYSMRNSYHLEKWALAGGDALTLMLAFLLGRLGGWWITGIPLDETFTIWWGHLGAVRLTVSLAIAMGTILWFGGIVGHYTRRKPYWDELRETLQILLTAALVDAVVVYFGKWQFSRVWLVTNWSFALLLVPAMRVLVKNMLIRGGLWVRPSVIIGVGENAKEAAAALQSDRLIGYRFFACLTLKDEVLPPGSQMEIKGGRLPIIALGQNPEALLAEMGHPQVVIALEPEELKTQQELLQRLGLCCADLVIVPSLRGLPLLGLDVSYILGHEVLLLKVRNNLSRGWAQLAKRCFDILASAALLALSAPLFAYISWQIGKTGTPVFYGHRRIGQHGKEFLCYKFRSMVPDADRALKQLLENDPASREEWDNGFKLKNDPRITPFGQFLRRTSLDELPQLWNVLKGEMSLVGPRPIVQEELGHYGAQAAYYLQAKPGITGLWQVSGRSDVNWMSRAFLDTWYVKNWSLWSDIVILLKTPGIVLARDGAY